MFQNLAACMILLRTMVNENLCKGHRSKRVLPGNHLNSIRRWQ